MLRKTNRTRQPAVLRQLGPGVAQEVLGEPLLAVPDELVQKLLGRLVQEGPTACTVGRHREASTCHDLFPMLTPHGVFFS